MTELTGNGETTNAELATRDKAGVSSQSEPLSALTTNLSETADILFSAGSVHSTLEQVVAVAVHTIEGCDFAGLFLLEGGVVVTPVTRIRSSKRSTTCSVTLARGRVLTPSPKG